MEQKQLDELDETFFGEEFVDDETDSVTIQSAKEGSKTMNSKKSVINTKKKPVAMANKTPVKKAKPETKTAKTAVKHLSKESAPKKMPLAEPGELKIEVVKTPLEKVGPIEISSPINPWSEEKTTAPSSSFFSDASTWKAITGMVIILLLVSVFTQGFNFSGSSSFGSELSQEEAEAKVLAYVNTILQPPYVAKVESSQAVNDLYLVRLSVADQPIDSYITKDGSLFFPQGFDTSKSLEEQTAQNTEASLEVTNTDASVTKEDIPPAETDSAPGEESTDSVDAAAVAEAPSEDVPSEQPAPPLSETDTSVMEIKMTSRKWMFFPQKVTANAGSPIKLTLTPDNSNPTFALPSYTFSIPQLGVEKVISGPTTLELTPETPGSYPFSCSSCEDWRGMNGVLIVQ